jgi:cbb3-type cytochrome oxidase cytochrome c subunit
MSELLKKVAALLGIPENLIQRSAEARGEASGKSTEEVLQSWSGEEVVEEAPQEEAVEEEVVEEAPQEEAVEEEVVEEVLVLAEKENSNIWALGILAFILFAGVFTLFLPLSQVLEQAEGKGEISVISDGAIIYNQESCQGCHSQNIRQLIPDAGIGKVTGIELLSESEKHGDIVNTGLRRIGPDLSTIGDREPTNNAKWLKRYLKNPSSVRPNIPHPKYDYLSDNDLDSLIEYLLELSEAKNE